MLLETFLSGTKKPLESGFNVNKSRNQLLDFGFLVDHVFTNNRIIFFYFHLAALVTLVFGRCVKVTRVSSGYQFDFIAHRKLLLNFIAA
jgi:hypothetical protein